MISWRSGSGRKPGPARAILLLLFVALLAACSARPPSGTAQPSVPGTGSPPATADAPNPVPTPAPTPALPLEFEATLLAIGDIMVHSPQLPAYYDADSDRYDFTEWFERVAPIFREGDWVVGNLETALAGADLKYTGYPRFNAPAELADALREAGVQLVSTANNHSMDRGFAGIERTLDHVRQAGLIPYGTAASAEEAERIVTAERGGIQMGFLAYTYGTNGIPIPSDKPFAVSLIDTDRMVREIGRLREAGVDIVTVSLHFGAEYQRLPNDEQRRIVRAAIGAGADIVLGSHPHVVQPYDIVNVPADESPLQQERSGIVIYSLGNFISNQTGDWKDVGLVFGVHLKKIQQPDGSSATTWDRVSFVPTWVRITGQGRNRHYTVLPLRETLASRDVPGMAESEYARMQKMLDGIEQHLHAYQQ